MVYPKDLSGLSNGKLPDDLLTTQGYPNTSSARLHHLASRAFRALDATVKDSVSGETLTTTSSPDCYRTYEQQYNTFMKRYTTDYIAGASTKDCMGDIWYLKPGYAM